MRVNKIICDNCNEECYNTKKGRNVLGDKESVLTIGGMENEKHFCSFACLKTYVLGLQEKKD